MARPSTEPTVSTAPTGGTEPTDPARVRRRWSHAATAALGMVVCLATAPAGHAAESARGAAAGAAPPGQAPAACRPSRDPAAKRTSERKAAAPPG
ncbi:hypothetical protein ABT372_36830, partial [Streptomyces lydicus]